MAGENTFDAPAVLVGCDVQEIHAIEAALQEFGERYLRRVLHPNELSQASNCSGDRLSAYLCGRFAAKEAVFKTLKATATDALPWPDIEVGIASNGAPAVRLHRQARMLAERARLTGLSVSITHSGDFAFAVATATTSDT